MRKESAGPTAIPGIDEDEIMNRLLQATAPEMTPPVRIPPGGRFKSMASEAGRRRRKRLLHETLLFLGTSLMLLGLETALLSASLLVFGLFQGLGLMGGLVAFLAFTTFQRREVDRT